MKRKIIIINGVIVCGVFVMWIWFAIVPVLRVPSFSSSTKILDRNGGLLFEVGDKEKGIRKIITFDEIPDSLKNALVASEDKRFYNHHGVDIRAIGRVFFEMLKTGHIASGASTIEQQLVKNIYFADQPRSIIQKMREMTAALWFAYTHSKDETLVIYLNSAYFGNRSYGIGTAARTYFHKSVKDLTVLESAMLVSVLPAPSRFEPYRHKALSNARMRYVLQRMVVEHMITKQEAENALERGITLFATNYEIQSPHFVLYVLDELSKQFPDIETGGYVIHTTIDPDLQRVVQTSINRRIARLSLEHVNNASVIAIHPETGEILAYVGNVDYFDEKHSGAIDMVQVPRQTGSVLKPFLYLYALMHGYTPASVIADVPVRFETGEGTTYYPHNYGNTYAGPVSLRDALGSSLNIPAVKILNQVGLSNFFEVLKKFGILFEYPPDYYGLQIVLGGGEATLMDIAYAYARLALYGHTVNSVSVLKVENNEGNVVYTSRRPEHKPLFEDQNKVSDASELIADILSDSSARSRSFGEANLLDIQKRIAVKTGTTYDFHDNWAFGYTPQFVLGVWVGNADNTPMKGVSGISGAVPIWHDIMRYVYDKKHQIAWNHSKNIVSVNICVPSGLRATELCPKTRMEKFIEGTEPNVVDSWYKSLEIDAKTGLLATPSCNKQIVRKTFLIPPQEYRIFSEITRYEQPPKKDCNQGEVKYYQDELSIISPLQGEVFAIDQQINQQNQRISFIAGGEAQRYTWELNGEKIETSEPVFLWEPRKGNYILKLGNRQTSFSVK